MHRVPLVSQDLQEELVPLAQLVQLESLDPLVHLEKRVLVVFVVIMDLLVELEREDQQVHLAVLETKETLERMDPRVPMVLQVQLALQDREALWVFQVRGESAGCQAFQDQLVHQENKDPQEQVEIKVPLAQLVLLD